MGSLGSVLGVMVAGFWIGAAARWLVPGPDPMPFWLTVGIGLAGSIAGGGIAALVFHTSHVMTTAGHIFVTLLLEIAVATAVVAAYRRLVQRRALTGPDAQRFPTRGVGIARMRARLHQVGIDPEQFHGRHGFPPRPTPTPTPAPQPQSTDELDELRDLHEKGILTDEEFEAARKRLYL